MINQKIPTSALSESGVENFPGYHLSRNLQHPIDGAKLMFLNDIKKYLVFFITKETKEIIEIRNLFKNNFLTDIANFQMRNVKKNV
ncbi:hypothetical protein [Chryseobacterium mulctrae]